MPNEKPSSLVNDIIAGLGVFLAMSYVAFAIPVMLSKAGVPLAPVFYGTCLMAALASFLSGSYAKAPAALAPGLALAAVIKQFAGPPNPLIDWEGAS